MAETRTPNNGEDHEPTEVWNLESGDIEQVPQQSAIAKDDVRLLPQTRSKQLLERTVLHMPAYDIHGWQITEDITWDLLRQALAELIGTMMFLWYTIATIIFFRLPTFTTTVADAANQPVSFTEGDSATQLMIAFAFGMSLAVIIYCFAGISGGHINPAVSLGLFVCKSISFSRTVIYTAAQLLGAMIGTAIAKGMNPDLYDSTTGGANRVSPDYTNGQALLGEIMGTAGLVFTVCRAIDREHYRNFISPFTIGLSVFVAHLVLIPVDGTSINPARSFGPAVVAGEWTGNWVFWIGPYIGAIISAGLYHILYRSKDA